jgi:phosphoribosylaminoimidazolecarboxamide formyltransferase / IMP cyclohydrolase
MVKKIKSALISVYYKDGLEAIVRQLHQNNVQIFSTGGTLDFIEKLGIPAKSVEGVTGYPSILGGRVKTLHPKIFGGILSRRDNKEDIKQMVDYQISEIDLVIVDLYPFEETLQKTNDEAEIIEKIDIGGISLIRAAAKNYADVVCIASSNEYGRLNDLLSEQNCSTTLEDRYYFATQAFNVSSHYDSAIFNYFNRKAGIDAFKISENKSTTLRYGENPHQKGVFYGDMEANFTQLHGKEISYNNIVDIEAALNLVEEFGQPSMAIIKHTNPCGIASANSILDAWNKALAADPVSAYGGVIAANRCIDKATAIEINKLFFEVIVAPDFEEEALELLKSKKNRMILKRKSIKSAAIQYKSVLNGVLCQDKDTKYEKEEELNYITDKKPTKAEIEDLLFAARIVKHTRSNAIVLVKDKQMISCGIGQTSRVDALNQAIEKAIRFGFDIKNSVMSSDAFFPFADCVELAHKAGVVSIIQPGGSVRDADSVKYCNENDLSMVFTGIRHFKH